MLGDILGGGKDRTQEIAGEKTVEAVSLGERDEVVGQHQSAEWMLPAGEDFEATEPAGAQLHERLEEGHDLAIVNRSAEGGCVVGRHTSHDGTPRFASYTEIFCAFQRATRSRAAGDQSG